MLHALNMDTNVKNTPGTLGFVIKDFYNLYAKTRIKFISSKYLKNKSTKGLKIIEQKLLKFSS